MAVFDPDRVVAAVADVATDRVRVRPLRGARLQHGDPVLRVASHRVAVPLQKPAVPHGQQVAVVSQRQARHVIALPLVKPLHNPFPVDNFRFRCSSILSVVSSSISITLSMGATASGSLHMPALTCVAKCTSQSSLGNAATRTVRAPPPTCSTMFSTASSAPLTRVQAGSAAVGHAIGHEIRRTAHHGRVQPSGGSQHVLQQLLPHVVQQHRRDVLRAAEIAERIDEHAPVDDRRARAAVAPEGAAHGHCGGKSARLSGRGGRKRSQRLA